MAEEKDRKLYVEIIENGTVIDHIKAGFAVSVLKILSLEGKDGKLITVGINVKSNSSPTGKKDIVKVENTYLDEKQINQIALISPDCKVSLIENYKVKEKFIVKLPGNFKGIFNCPNERCVSNKEREPVLPEFNLISEDPLKISCAYCDRILKREEILRILEKLR